MYLQRRRVLPKISTILSYSTSHRKISTTFFILLSVFVEGGPCKLNSSTRKTITEQTPRESRCQAPTFRSAFFVISSLAMAFKYFEEKTYSRLQAIV